jgi:hypothetical protein
LVSLLGSRIPVSSAAADFRVLQEQRVVLAAVVLAERLVVDTAVVAELAQHRWSLLVRPCSLLVVVAVVVRCTLHLLQAPAEMQVYLVLRELRQAPTALRASITQRQSLLVAARAEA